MNGFKEVTKDQFFDVIGLLDVHPRSERDKTYWEDRARQLIGISTPGYSSNDAKSYFLRETNKNGLD